MVDYPGLLDDLAAEEADLDTVVARIDDNEWVTPTPAAGWDVRDSIAHLAVSEDLAATALDDPDRFAVRLAAMLADLAGTEASMLRAGRARAGPDVLAWWRTERARVLDGLGARDAADRIPWVTGRLSAVSFATARLMETWAHGQDVVDALGANARTDGAASPRRRPRRTHPAVQLRRQRARAPRRRRARGADRSRRRHVDVGRGHA